MNIFRVVISFIREHMSFMHERGALAMTPGQALDEVVSNLQINMTQINSFKSWTEIPTDLNQFNQDCLFMTAVGSDLLLRDLWKRKHGDM